MKLTKIQDAQPLGQYQPTAQDTAKDNADILIEAANGGSYTIKSQVEIKGRGLKKTYSNGLYEVTSNMLDSLSLKYSVECNF